jgi:hypothetical protein
MRSLKFLAASVLMAGALTVIALGRAALAADPVPKTDGSRTKVFRLAHTDPAEVRQVMENMLESIPVDAPKPPPMPMPVPMVGFAGGGALGFQGGPVVPSAYSLSTDARTRSVIVRGTEKHLQLATDVVAVLDLTPGKAPPEVKTLRAVVLQNAKPEELAQVLESLEFEGKIVPLPAAKMIVFTGPEQVMKDVANLIKELDVPADKESKKEERKKLFNDPPDGM